MPKLVVGQSIPMAYETSNTPFGIACTYFAGKVVRDRFGYLNQFSDFNWTDHIDNIPNAVQHSLFDLMDQRANEFRNKSITVQWSGGVDSTALLLSLIKNGINKEDFVVFYDTNSMEEYPKLYNWLVDQKYNMKQVKNWKKALIKTDTDVITNGWCADQLFGSIFFHQCPGKYFLSLPELMRSTEVLSGALTEEEISFATETFQKYGKKLFNIDINIAGELGWFINFIMKWTWVSTYNELYLVGTKNQFKTEVFYNTPYFQEWSVNNFNNIKEYNIYGKDPFRYKRPLKEYIVDVFKDEEYLVNKTKRPSWNSALSRTKQSFTGTTVLKTESDYRILALPTISIPNAPGITWNTLFTKFKK